MHFLTFVGVTASVRDTGNPGVWSCLNVIQGRTGADPLG